LLSIDRVSAKWDGAIPTRRNAARGRGLIGYGRHHAVARTAATTATPIASHAA
jgi:hypothetical protein